MTEVSRGSPGGLGARVREQRRLAGLTQQQLADAAGVSVGVVRDLEQGRTASPQRGSVRRLTAVLARGGAAPSRGTPPDPDGPGLPAGQKAPVTPSPEPWPLGRSGDGAVGNSGPAREHGRSQPAPAAPLVRLRVLGPLEVWRGDALLELGWARWRAVLGLLALHPNQTLHRDAIIDALWGDRPPGSAVTMVQSSVGRLRRLLDPEASPRARDGLLVSAATGYRLQAGAAVLDLAEFGALTQQAGGARLAGDLAGACALYASALGLWRGEPLADIDVLKAHPAVIGLSQRQAAVVEEYAEAAAQAGSPEQPLPELRALVLREPLRERAHARLMIALAGSGQQAAALEVYDELRRRLDDQLGVQPGPELTGAYTQVLRGEVPGPAGAGAVAGAPAVPVTVPRQLPGAPRHFVGRAGELSELTGLLDEVTQPGGTVVISAIDGMAGIGKTALALHWAHQAAGRFPDGQLYVNLRGFDPSGSPAEPAEVIRGFLDALGVPPARVPASPDAQPGLFRSLLAGKRVLVLLDNARDAQQVRPLLPGSAGCLVLVTSRHQMLSLAAAEGARRLVLDPLSGAEAAELLTRRLGASRVGRDQDAVSELITLCARLPLALRIVAARAAGRPELPLADLAAQLRDPPSRLDALRAGDPATDVRAVLSWSLAHLSVPAARMFALLGVYPGPDISPQAAASLAGIPTDQAGELLGELARASLLAEHAPGRFACHDLVRAYASERAHDARTDEEREAAVRRVLSWYLHTARAAGRVLMPASRLPTLAAAPPHCEPLTFAGYEQALAWCDTELANLTAAVRAAEAAGHDDVAAGLPAVLWDYLKLRRPTADWEAYASAGIRAARRMGDIRVEASMLGRLGTAYRKMNRSAEAADCYRQALRIRREIGDREGEGAILNNLGTTWMDLGRYGDAAGPLQQALVIAREVGDRLGECIAMDNLGETYLELQRPEEALGCHVQSLIIARDARDKQGEGNALNNLGKTHRSLRQFGAAREHYQQALAIRRAAGDRRGEAASLRDLGHLLDQTGQPDVAREYWRQAQAILDDLDHPGSAKPRKTFAVTLTIGPAVGQSSASGSPAPTAE